MNLSLKGFSQLVEDMSAALQSSASALIDVSVGSVIRAIFEANASVVLWLQWLILQVLQTTRAATSTGADLDSWMLDFSLVRLPAVPATGIVTFTRFVSGLPATIPVGTIIKTTDGTVSFSVVEDDTSPLWQSSTSCYVMPSGTNAATVSVVATVGGTVGNVLSGTINVIAASLPGIDQVTNPTSFTDGVDAESDQAFRARFQSFLASRSRATLTSVRNAINSVQQGLMSVVLENTSSSGTSQSGSFLVVVDDGSGYPSSGLLNSVFAAVDAVRPIGSIFYVMPPQVLTVNVVLAVTLNATANAGLIVPGIQASVAAYLNSLSIGASASVTRVAQNVYVVGDDITNVATVQLNGGLSDVSVPALTVIKAGQVTVTYK